MRKPVIIVSFLGLWLPACKDGAECKTASDCPANSICVESRCRAVCNGNSDCPGGQYCIEGTCRQIECVPGARCDDGDPCTEEDECDVLGSCVGTPVACDQIPAPECIDSDTRRTYSAGSCQRGECVYPHTDSTCVGCPSCQTTECTIGVDSFGSGAVNPANGCELCDLAEPTAWTDYVCETGISTDPCLTNTGTCDPTLDSSSCQLNDCCEVEPSWPTGSTGAAPSCPLGQEDTDHDGIEDAGENWTGSCTHAGECVGCSSNEDCDDGDPCSVDTCNEPFCEHDWTTRLGQACTVNAGDDGRCIDTGSRAECKLVNGEPCNPDEPSECEDGWCVDGVCCDSDCNGVCQSCAGAETVGSNGECSNITAGTDPAAECSGGSACNGGSCAASCSPTCADSDDCEAAYYCDSSGSCTAPLDNGTPPDTTCGAASCSSGIVADGYCCDDACSTPCRSCAEAGLLGTCSNYTGANDGTCSGPSSYCCDGTCGTHGYEYDEPCGSGDCAGVWACSGTTGVCSSSGSSCDECSNDMRVPGTCRDNGTCILSSLDSVECEPCRLCVDNGATTTCSGFYAFGVADPTGFSGICQADRGCDTDDCACNGWGGCLGTSGSTGCYSDSQCLSGSCTPEIRQCD